MGELRHALGEDELVLHYQPKVDLGSRRTIGIEALVRWIHPRHGLMLPGQFIPQADQTDLIGPLTAWVLDNAMRDLSEWLSAGIDTSMSVNLAARNLHDPELPVMVHRALEAWAVPPSRLRLEITESIAMDAADDERLRQLTALGIGLTIDDFGTGYSALSYLKRLPMDEIKIDRTFIVDMAGSGDDAAIVRPTIDLGHNLGLKVVAEGVENEATLQLLTSFGCDSAQGFHLCRPLPPDELTPWLLHNAMGAPSVGFEGAAVLTSAAATVTRPSRKRR
jgi:EAL domain-containing protein (putative c-di-GMP-specific phosphodiesterase class I)